MKRKYVRQRSSPAEIERLNRADMIRDMLATGLNQSEIARKFGISRQAINQVLYRHKERARRMVAHDLERGHLVKPTKCEQCLEQVPLQAHHTDYGLPTDVKWYCRPCHSKQH